MLDDHPGNLSTITDQTLVPSTEGPHENGLDWPRGFGDVKKCCFIHVLSPIHYCGRPVLNYCCFAVVDAAIVVVVVVVVIIFAVMVVLPLLLLLLLIKLFRQHAIFPCLIFC